jgi:hypothetical protein
MTLKAAGVEPNVYESQESAPIIPLPTSLAFQAIEQRQEWPRINMQAYQQDGHYIVIVEQQNEAPIDFILLPEPALAGKITFTFDEKTGQLLSRNVETLLESNTWLLTESQTYLTSEFVSELPVEKSQWFTNSVNSLLEDAQK